MIDQLQQIALSQGYELEKQGDKHVLHNGNKGDWFTEYSDKIKSMSLDEFRNDLEKVVRANEVTK